MSASADRIAQTRRGWHRVAEHLLAAAQYAETGRIGLRPVPGGFATRQPLRDGLALAVERTDLVVTDVSGTRRTPLTTLGAAAAFAGVTPGLPDTVYPVATSLDLDAPLGLDPEAAGVLGDWYALADTALRAVAGDDDPPVLWPEHFDLGVSVDAINYGASPGDAEIDAPYLYVGPHSGPPTRDEFWNAPFGAARTIDAVPSVAAAVAFFETGRTRATATG